jgi:UDP-N-acetylmuramoyl-L-alanyl-D-glutamate--2,6-diaminopimelate ligase
MTFAELLRTVKQSPADVAGIAVYPEQVKPGTIVVDLGPKAPRRLALADAIGRGASWYVTSDAVADPRAVRVKNAFAACADLAAAWFARPARALDCYGVTGTKGKTTTCHLLAHLVESERPAALLSSVVRRAGQVVQPAMNTTPIALELQAWLRIAANEGLRRVIIETTSIGLAEERVRGIGFKAVALTNVGSDHLQYHGGRDAYVAQKRRLFEDTTVVRKDAVRLVNLDDPVGARLRRDLDRACVTFGSAASADYRFTIEGQRDGGLSMTVNRRKLWSPLYGRVNAENVACAAALAREIGLTWDVIRDRLASFPGVPGRLELVSDPGAAVAVVVDYAHTPESVDGAISAIRSRFRRRALTVVVGCGGGTDREKRPRIAQIAARRAQRVFFTSDNPRWESAEEIGRDMMRGVPETHRRKTRLIIDRREAIRAAIASSDNGVVAVVGRGCEPYLEIEGRREIFDDREVARSILREQQ